MLPRTFLLRTIYLTIISSFAVYAFACCSLLFFSMTGIGSVNIFRGELSPNDWRTFSVLSTAFSRRYVELSSRSDWTMLTQDTSNLQKFDSLPEVEQEAMSSRVAPETEPHIVDVFGWPLRWGTVSWNTTGKKWVPVVGYGPSMSLDEPLHFGVLFPAITNPIVFVVSAFAVAMFVQLFIGIVGRFHRKRAGPVPSADLPPKS